MDTPAVLTIPETALLLRCCEKTVWRGIQSGHIPSLRIHGRKIVVPRPALDKLLAGESLTNGNNERDAAAR